MFYVIRDSYSDYEYEIIAESNSYRGILRKMIEDVKNRSGEDGADIDVDALVDVIDNGEECEDGNLQIWDNGALIDGYCRWGIAEWKGKGE